MTANFVVACCCGFLSCRRRSLCRLRSLGGRSISLLLDVPARVLVEEVAPEERVESEDAPLSRDETDGEDVAKVEMGEDVKGDLGREGGEEVCEACACQRDSRDRGIMLLRAPTLPSSPSTKHASSSKPRMFDSRGELSFSLPFQGMLGSLKGDSQASLADLHRLAGAASSSRTEDMGRRLPTPASLPLRKENDSCDAESCCSRTGWVRLCGTNRSAPSDEGTMGSGDMGGADLARRVDGKAGERGRWKGDEMEGGEKRSHMRESARDGDDEARKVSGFALEEGRG